MHHYSRKFLPRAGNYFGSVCILSICFCLLHSSYTVLLWKACMHWEEIPSLKSGVSVASVKLSRTLLVACSTA